MCEPSNSSPLNHPSIGRQAPPDRGAPVAAVPAGVDLGERTRRKSGWHEVAGWMVSRHEGTLELQSQRSMTGGRLRVAFQQPLSKEANQLVLGHLQNGSSGFWAAGLPSSSSVSEGPEVASAPRRRRRENSDAEAKTLRDPAYDCTSPGIAFGM